MAIGLSGVADFRWRADSTEVRWNHAGEEVVRRYAMPILKAIALNDGSGVAIVEHPDEAGRDNAVVLNADGSLRFRIKLPAPASSGYAFWELYYVGTELTAFAAISGGDFACVIDPSSGEIMRKYETR